MSELRRNFLVGAFMIAGLAVLGVLLVMFGEAPSWLGGAEWELHIYVHEIAGIDEGTPIYLNGIKIGRVVNLDFVNAAEPEQGVDVIGRIKNRFQVPRGSRAICYGPALGLGRGRVEILAEGAGMSPLSRGEKIDGIAKNPLEEVIPQSLISSFEGTVTKIGSFADALTPVADDLHELLRVRPVAEVDDPSTQARRLSANFYTAVERLDTVLRNIDRVVGDPAVRSGLLEAVENVRQMSADGKAAFADLRDTGANLKADSARITDKVEGAVDNMNSRVSQLADAAMPVLDHTARAAANLSLVTTNLAEGRGTIGKLLNDERFYEVLLLSIERIRDSADSLRRLMDRFEKQGRLGLNWGGLAVDKPIPQK